MKIKIAIADDHPLMIDGIKTALSETSKIKIIGEALNGKQLLLLMETIQPDIVLLDIRMPELDGLDTLEIMKSKYPETKVIMLSQYSERGMVKKSIEFGAKAYLLKDCGKNKLVETITKVFNGGIYFNLPNVRKKETHGLNCDNPKSLLSCRELDVLELLAKDFSYGQIAEKLGIELSSVKTYKLRLKRKSGTHTLSGLVAWAYQNNIV